MASIINVAKPKQKIIKEKHQTCNLDSCDFCNGEIYFGTVVVTNDGEKYHMCSICAAERISE